MKNCQKCKTVKPFAEFALGGKKGRLYSYCRLCNAAKAKAWRVLNRERHRAVSLESHYRNREKNNAMDRARYLADTAGYCKRAAEYRKANPVKVLICFHAWRGAREGAEGSFTVAEWIDLCNRFGNKCLACGKPEVTVDHVVPLSKGGSNDISNIQPLCMSCNQKKHVQSIDYRLTASY